MMLPKLKVYEVDYSFIIQNYLDVNLWDKQWTLFEFDEFSICLQLSSIDCCDREINFEIKIIDKHGHERSEFISYNLQNTSIKILIQQINGAMYRCVHKMETAYIENSEVYRKAMELWNEERDRLHDIAEAFLDDEGVTNDDIRDAYIDKYVDDNDKSYYLSQQLKDEQEFKVLTKLYVTLLKTSDDKLNQQRLEEIENKIGQASVKSIEKEIEEYYEYLESDNYVTDMELNLVGI